MSLQDALYHPCFNYRAVAVYNKKDSVDDSTFLSTLANLMKTFETAGYTNDVVKILVAVNPKHVTSQLEAASISADVMGGTESKLFTNKPGDALIQINSENSAARTYASRFCAAVLGPVAEAEFEITGEKDTFQSDALGFYQEKTFHPKVTVDSRCDIGGALSGCSWLLAQQYALDISSFIRRTDHAQFDSMGASFADRRRDDPAWYPAPNSAHRNVMAPFANRMIRRGFSYRRDGKEGLQFLACSKEMPAFSSALADASSKSDEVFKFATANPGGLYFVPNNSAYFGTSPTPINSSLSTNEADIIRHLLTHSSGSLVEAVDYTVAKSFLSYVTKVKGLGSFTGIYGSMSIDPVVMGKLDEIHRYLARTNRNSAAIPPIGGYNLVDHKDLNDFLTSALAEANRINGLFDDYMTLA